MHTGSTHRTPLAIENRHGLLPYFEDDVRLLTRLTGQNFEDWLTDAGPTASSVRHDAAKGR